MTTEDASARDQRTLRSGSTSQGLLLTLIGDYWFGHAAYIPSAALVAGPRTSSSAPWCQSTAAWFGSTRRSARSSARPDGPNAWRGTVRTSMFLGSHTEYAVDVAGELFRVWQPDATLTDEGADQWLGVAPAHVRVLPAGDETDADQDG